MMKTLRYLMIGLMTLAALTLAACGGSGGGGGGGGGAAPDVLVDGHVIQGPVSGATVFGDLNENFAVDAGEVSTISGEDGSFSFSIPADYGAYFLVSLGGIDTISGKLAMPMVAPAGAANITPVTTLVALTPAGPQRDALIAQLNALSGGAGYDSNPSDPAGVAPAFLTLTKAVEEILFAMGELGVTQTTDLLHVVEAIAKSINDSDTPLADSNLSDLMRQAVANITSPTITVPDVILEDLFSDLTTGVADTIAGATNPDGAVVENEELVGNIDNTNSELIANTIAANAVISAISALPAANDLTLDNATQVTQVRTAFTNLNDAAKALVTNLATLTTAESRIEAIAAAQTVINAINNLPQLEPVDEATLTTQTSAVTLARDAYNGLSELPGAQGLVTNIGTLGDAERRITALKTALDDAKAFGTLVTTLNSKSHLNATDVENADLAHEGLLGDARIYAANLGFLNLFEALQARIEAVANTIYQIDLLPGLAADSFSAGIAVNGAFAAGYAADEAGTVKAVLWDFSQPEISSTVLPPLEGTVEFPIPNTYSAAYGINIDSIVGESGDDGDSTTVAVIWVDGAVSKLATEYVTSAAYSINNSGAIVGEAVDNGDTVAIYWPSSGATAVTLANLVEPGASSAYFINDEGSIVGESLNADGFMQAVVWPLNGTTPGAPIALEEIDDNQISSVAFGVNSNGYIVGEAELANGTVVGVLWIATGHVVAIDNASAQAINNTMTGADPLVVGQSNPVSDNGHATVWNVGFPADLQELYTEGQSLALGVSDDGDIVGVVDGQAFIAVPTDE